MSHTPGPWYLLPARTRVHLYANDKHIGISLPYRSSPSDMANARLIAAAPEMLATLRFVREQIVTNLAGHDGCRCVICEAIPVECDKAIAKATGGAK